MTHCLPNDAYLVFDPGIWQLLYIILRLSKYPSLRFSARNAVLIAWRLLSPVVTSSPAFHTPRWAPSVVQASHSRLWPSPRWKTVWEMNAPEVFQMRCFKTRIVDDCWRRDCGCVCWSIFLSFVSKCSTGGRPRKMREAFNNQSRRDLWCERNIRESKSNIFPICLSLRVPRSCFLKRRYRISKLQIWRNCCQGLRCRTLRNGSPQSQHFSLHLFAHLQCSVDVASLILWFLLWLVVLYFPHHPSVTESLQSEQKP